MKDTITKPKNIDYFQVPDELWQRIQHHFPNSPKPGARGRPPTSGKSQTTRRVSLI